MKFTTVSPLLAIWLATTVATSAHAPPTAAIATTNSARNSSVARELKYKNCVPPPNAVPGKWRYCGGSKAYTGCTTDHEFKPWTMLNAYQGGGLEDSYWRYADGKNHPVPCLKDWTYYGQDGKWLITRVDGEYTTQGDSKPWCAMTRYRKGGKQGKQWDYCTCEQAKR